MNLEDDAKTNIILNYLRKKMIKKKVFHKFTNAKNTIEEIEYINDLSTNQMELQIRLVDENKGIITINFFQFISLYQILA
jgi:hypothetical protein